MARFYDTMNDAELVRVEGLLNRGGIGYYLRDAGGLPSIKEIVVAEEDMAYAEQLLNEDVVH